MYCWVRFVLAFLFSTTTNRGGWSTAGARRKGRAIGRPTTPKEKQLEPLLLGRTQTKQFIHQLFGNALHVHRTDAAGGVEVWGRRRELVKKQHLTEVVGLATECNAQRLEETAMQSGRLSRNGAALPAANKIQQPPFGPLQQQRKGITRYDTSNQHRQQSLANKFWGIPRQLSRDSSHALRFFGGRQVNAAARHAAQTFAAVSVSACLCFLSPFA